MYLEWINKNQKNYQIKIYENKWVNRNISYLYNFKTEMIFDGILFKGFSTDTSRDMASFKSFVECVERIASFRIGAITTNGCAIHSKKETSESLASAELLERDVFLFYYINGWKFPLTYPRLFDFKTKRILESFRRVGTEIELFKLKDLLGKDVFVCRVKFNVFDQGSVWGMGRSFYHAVKEVVHDVLLTFTEKVDSLSLTEFLKIKTPKFNDHYRLALNKDFDSKVNAIVRNGYSSPRLEKLKPQINFFTIDLSDRFFPGLPLYFSRATSSACQNLYTGKLTKEKFNGKRFQVDFEKVIDLPHPLG